MGTQQHSWELQYLDALLANDHSTVAEYESLEFFSSLATQRSGVQEVVLYRLISRLESTDDAIKLLYILENSLWEDYAPRVLARVADTDELLREYPDLSTLLQRIYEDRSGATNYSLGSWRLIGDPDRIQRSKSPPWSRRATSLSDIINRKRHSVLRASDIRTIVEHFHEKDVRIYSLAVMTFHELPTVWADTLHRVLAIPYMNVVSAPISCQGDVVPTAPSGTWTPKWQVKMSPDGWHVEEAHTGAAVDALGSLPIYDVLSVLLSLGGLLRDGVMSSPTTTRLVRPLTIAQPIWGFRDTQYSAESTRYRTFDIRALALGFLECLPATDRVMAFRSRLAMNLVAMNWNRRRSASVVTPTGGLYKQLVHAAQLFGRCQFGEVIQFVEGSPQQYEPAMQNLLEESNSAIAMLEEAQQRTSLRPTATVEYPERVLCVTHASVPYQTGGYAIRAHGILSQLRQHKVDIKAVTRPGFPDGPLTAESRETIDDVEYLHIPATEINRAEGEMQHMQSYIEAFEELFMRLQIGKVHVRSTFLIALPALIAARRLSLPILYEVSGLWELVYSDREHDSHLLKKSQFAELAETVTMRNVDSLIVMNEAVQEIAISRGTEPQRIAIAPNAVSVDRFRPMAPPANEFFTIGYLGSFVDYEGLDLLLDAIKILNSSSKTAQLLMVGDGARFSAIKNRVLKEGLEDHVELTGRIPHDKVQSMYERMDVLVYPRISTHATEAITPLKPFEALAMEKPIVVSNVMPLLEIVGSDQRGLVFKAGDPTNMASVIRRLMEHPGLGEGLGEAGRKWVLENRNWNTVIDVFRDAYAALGE